MRIIFPLAALALLGACAATPTAPVKPTPVAVAPQMVERGTLMGLTSAEIIRRLGAPRLTVVEGTGIKVQWQATNCVLDAYLYPPTGRIGQATVTHVEARDRSGRDIPQANCLAVLQPR